MLTCTLMREMGVRGTREVSLEIPEGDQGASLPSYKLNALVNDAEREALPSGDIFRLTLRGGGLVVFWKGNVAIEIDGDRVRENCTVFRDRGTLTINGMTLIYTVKYS